MKHSPTQSFRPRLWRGRNLNVPTQNKIYIVYILMNTRRKVSYIGMTSDIVGRLYDHKHRTYPNSFTARYNVDELVYYEMYEDAYEAVSREREIKKWRKEKKLVLIKSLNPTLKDLSGEFVN